MKRSDGRSRRFWVCCIVSRQNFNDLAVVIDSVLSPMLNAFDRFKPRWSDYINVRSWAQP